MLASKTGPVLLVTTIIMVSLFVGHPANASNCSGASYCTNPNKALAVDYNSDYNHGNTLGEYGSATQFDYVAPGPANYNPTFYGGVLGNSVIGTSQFGAGLKNLHITMEGLFPNGARIDGLHMVADQPLEGPNSSSQSQDPLESFVRTAVANAFPYGIGTDLLYLSTFTQSNPQEYGRDNYDVYADWSCQLNVQGLCIDQYGNFAFQDASLKDSFHLTIDPNQQGTYLLQFIYHVDFQYCSSTVVVKGGTVCSADSDLTQDYIDNLLYCYVTCSGNGASFVSQTPNTGTQTVQLNPSQTTYLDSQFSTSTFNTADPIYVGTYQKTQDALIGFSLSTLPANSVITSANIQVYQSQANPSPFGGLRCNGSSGQCQISVSQISASWDASKATWNNPPSTTGSQTVLRYPSPGQWTIDVTSQVQTGYSSGNFYGIELSPADTTEVFQYAIASGLSQSQLPVLTINYVTYTSPPSTMCTGQTANVQITMSNNQIVWSGGVGTTVSLSNWLPSSMNPTNPFVLESESPEGNSNWGMSSVALSTYVLYTQSYTFSFTVTAPSVPGTYNFQWRMAQQGLGSFGDYTPKMVINVVACPNFTVSASPSSISMAQYTCWPSTISVASTNGFSGPVTLAYSSYPLPSIVASFNGCWGSQGSTTVNVPLGGTATATITFNSCYASPGTYPITVTATSSNPSITHQTTITVNVIAYSSSCDGGGGASLAYGSLITMADGSQVPVQNLKVGAQLQGYDPSTGQYETSTILSIVTKHATNMLIINTATGTPLRVDASQTEVLWTRHPDGTTLWLPAPMLHVGDDLWTPNGWVAVTSINFAPAGNHTMYDITATVPYFANGYLDPPHPS